MFKSIFPNIINKYNNLCKKSKFTSKIILSSVSIILLTNCSLDGNRDYYADNSAEQIYTEAVEHLNKGRFEAATKSYEALETHFPFGEFTTKGQLEVIYAYYKDLEYLQSITAAERFLRLHPLSENADYAYYLHGVANFEHGTTMMTRWLPNNPALRDVTNFKMAFDSFKKVVVAYPNSKYATDARTRMVYIRNILAEHELTVAKYYMEREAFLAAANRARYVIEHLPNTPAEQNAVAILKETYNKLNLASILKSKDNNQRKVNT